MALFPNKVLTVVALRLICEPITVCEILVPKVWLTVVFWAWAAAVSIPIPVKVLSTLTSAIVH